MEIKNLLFSFGENLFMQDKDKKYHTDTDPVGDNYIIPYGKYRGKKIANVPASYLIWAFESGNCSFQVGYYVQENMDVLLEEVKRGKAKKENDINSFKGHN